MRRRHVLREADGGANYPLKGNEFVEDALRALIDRERRLVATEEGLADIAAGRIHDVAVVFDELEGELTKLAEE